MDPPVTDRLTDRQAYSSICSSSDEGSYDDCLEYVSSPYYEDEKQLEELLKTYPDPYNVFKEVPQEVQQEAPLVGETPLVQEPFFAEMKKVPKDKFRINNQRLFLTYSRADLDKKALKKHLREVTKRPEAKVKIARETHKDGGIHMHVAIDLGRAWQTRNQRILDFKGHHPNIAVVKDLVHWANCLVYLGKEDKSCKAAPWVIDAAKAWNCKSPAEAALSGACKGDPLRALLLYRAKPQVNRFTNLPEPTAPWYQQVLKPVLDNKTDHRSWYWFMDPIGNSQKSYTCKYFLSMDQKDVKCTKLTANADSWGMKLKRWVDEGWTGGAMLIDLCRARENSPLIYECLELVSDGWGDFGKYEGGDFILPTSPTVVVFANWWPKLSEGSQDRWKLYQITNDPVPLSARCMNLNEARAEREDRYDLREQERLERKIRVEERVCTVPTRDIYIRGIPRK